MAVEHATVNRHRVWNMFCGQIMGGLVVPMRIANGITATEGIPMDLYQFTAEVRRLLPANFGATADNCIWAVFQTLHQRLDPGQAGHLETHLPKELKKDWQIAISPQEQHRHVHEPQFLEEVRQRAGLNTLDEAREATLVVFKVLKDAIPAGDVEDTAVELPQDLRDLWLTEAF